MTVFMFAMILVCSSFQMALGFEPAAPTSQFVFGLFTFMIAFFGLVSHAPEKL